MNPQNGQTPLDYLNQIAPQAPKKARMGLNLRTVVFGGVILVVLVIIAAIVVGAVVSSRKGPWEQLSARLSTTQTIAEDATKKLKNSQIRSINSSLKLNLTNTQRDLTTPLQLQDINPKKLPESTVADEAAGAMKERLENARLNAKFDSTYAREMSYQLTTILVLYQELFNKSSNQSTRSTLESAYNNLAPLQKSLADFSAANE